MDPPCLASHVETLHSLLCMREGGDYLSKGPQVAFPYEQDDDLTIAFPSLSFASPLGLLELTRL